jgi:hypothetical protein
VVHHKVTIRRPGAYRSPLLQKRKRLVGKFASGLAQYDARAIAEEHPAFAGVFQDLLPDISRCPQLLNSNEFFSVDAVDQVELKGAGWVNRSD